MEKQISRYLISHKKEIIKSFNNIVNINSGTNNIKGVNTIGRFFINKFNKLGIGHKIYKYKNYGNSILFSNKHNPKNKTVLLLGHMDTVFPPNHPFQKFSITKNKKRAAGPGVADMKGGLIIILYAVKFLAEKGCLNSLNLKILFTSDEEAGSPESDKLINSIIKKNNLNCCLCFESGGSKGEIVTRRFGIGRFRIAVKGIASHPGVDPGGGVSAIEEIAHKVIALHKLKNIKKGILINVGLISGGIKPNIVAPRADASIDVRFKTILQGSQIYNTLKKIASNPELKGTETEISGKIHRPPMTRLKKALPIIKKVKEAGRKIGIEIQEEYRGGCSDANNVTAAGVPAIDGMGPVGGDDHSSKEYILLDSLFHRTELTILTLMSIYQGET